MSGQNDGRLIIGWREWVGLPDLGIEQIKAKIDTGARTSALHAFEVRPFVENGISRVEFKMHPRQHDNEYVIVCKANIIDERMVSDSGGHKELRPVIETLISIGSYSWPIEATLTARDDMLFRMLLGRTAITRRAQVDPARSYVVGKNRFAKKKKKKRHVKK